jgi:eukaryotic-like serine/threonine-protein kinase
VTLSPGFKLGSYEILSPLGAGGMGEVYRARDTKLNREVAIKVLPAAMAQDSERMARFQREAQVLASLNHPNIASIYGLEDSGGVRALVMELVEGQTLAERLKSGAMPTEEALLVVRQISDALEAAHERGIIHRDLKPANIKITEEGVVKVLDFGLAKAMAPEESSSGISNSPTISIAATQAGMILGTAAYMSPEQAKGKKVDRRADIWAFSCVFYEMLAGKKIFEGETTSDVLAAVIRAEPDWNALPENIPGSIRKLLQRCLQKDPKQRLRDIGDARITIEEVLSGDAELPTQAALQIRELTPQPAWRRALPWALAAFFLMAGVATFFLSNLEQPQATRMQFQIPVEAEVGNLAVSTDGRMLAFTARDDASGQEMLSYQTLGAPAATQIAGTEGASYPFWSPDDSYLGFFANGKLKKVPVTGGPPQVLATATFGRGGSWGTKGVIIYEPEAGGALWRVNADGSNAAPLTQNLFLPSDSSHRWPFFLPDGDHFLFWAGSFGTARYDLQSGISFSSLTAKERKQVVTAQSNAGFTNGHLYYRDDRGSLIAVPFDPARGVVSGEPVVISDHVTFQPSVIWASFGVGGNDTVVYNTSVGATLSEFTWYDRAGKVTGHVGERGVLANPTISPDGTHAVLDVADLKNANVDIWIDDLARNTSSRFTFNPAEEATGVWSRDGKLIAFRSVDSGAGIIYIKKSTGGETPKELYTSSGSDDIMPNSWAMGDRQILCSYQPTAGGSDLMLVDVGTGKKTPFVATNASETNGMISPDGKWAAYASNESGEWEIYVTTFPGVQGKWQISRGGGTEPRWRGDGKEIFYVDPKGNLTAVSVEAKEDFSAGAPLTLFPMHARAHISSTDLFSYDVSKDGKRFLVNRYVKPDHIQPLTVVLNATARSR